VLIKIEKYLWLLMEGSRLPFTKIGGVPQSSIQYNTLKQFLENKSLQFTSKKDETNSKLTTPKSLYYHSHHNINNFRQLTEDNTIGLLTSTNKRFVYNEESVPIGRCVDTAVWRWTNNSLSILTGIYRQGCARDLLNRDRDETETRR